MDIKTIVITAIITALITSPISIFCKSVYDKFKNKTITMYNEGMEIRPLSEMENIAYHGIEFRDRSFISCKLEDSDIIKIIGKLQFVNEGEKSYIIKNPKIVFRYNKSFCLTQNKKYSDPQTQKSYKLVHFGSCLLCFTICLNKKQTVELKKIMKNRFDLYLEYTTKALIWKKEIEIDYTIKEIPD
ncbi:MAG: hypothetical protein ACYCYI_00025 [Saccharofermentanales bacterium]